MDNIAGLLNLLLQTISGKVGIIAQVSSVLLLVQSFNKLLQVAIPAVRDFVKGTASPKDDELLQKAEDSKFAKGFKFLVDLLLRIKLP